MPAEITLGNRNIQAVCVGDEWMEIIEQTFKATTFEGVEGYEFLLIGNEEQAYFVPKDQLQGLKVYNPPPPPPTKE